MSKILKKLIKHLAPTSAQLTDKEVDLWVSLYHLTHQQQAFANAVMPFLVHSNHTELIKQAKEIIALDTVLRKNYGTLLEKIDQCQNPTLKKQLFALL